MKQYLRIMSKLYKVGAKRASRPDRTGVRTYSVFGPQIEFNLRRSFPLITTKKTSLRLISTELAWFLNGDTHIKTLLLQNNHIWTEWPFQYYLEKTEQVSKFPKYSEAWKQKMAEFEQQIVENNSFADEWDSIGDAYGYQWRHWPNYIPNPPEIDQISQVIYDLKYNPFSRRHIVTAWNPPQIPKMKLPPCHCFFQFYVTETGYLDCKLYQRSADWFLGVPFNIASYALLTYIIAHLTGLKPGRFIHTFGDAHLYSNHMEQAALQLSRPVFALPTLILNPDINHFENLKATDFILQNYQAHPHIPAEIAV